MEKCIISFRIINTMLVYLYVSVSFESHTCQSPKHPLNPSTSEVIILSYEGGSISCDHVAFSVLNDPDLLTFELMINPLYHEDPDCAIVLEYRTSLIKKALKVRQWSVHVPAPYITTKAHNIITKAHHITTKAHHIMTKAPNIATKAHHIMT